MTLWFLMDEERAQQIITDVGSRSDQGKNEISSRGKRRRGNMCSKNNQKVGERHPLPRLGHASGKFSGKQHRVRLIGGGGSGAVVCLITFTLLCFTANDPKQKKKPKTPAKLSTF